MLKKTFLNLLSDWVIDTDVVKIHLNKATKIDKLTKSSTG